MSSCNAGCSTPCNFGSFCDCAGPGCAAYYPAVGGTVTLPAAQCAVDPVTGNLVTCEQPIVAGKKPTQSLAAQVLGLASIGLSAGAAVASSKNNTPVKYSNTAAKPAKFGTSSTGTLFAILLFVGIVFWLEVKH
jgi:hypothetical protein